MIQWGVNVGGMGMGRAQDGYMRHGVYGTDYRKNTQAEIDYLAAHGFDYHRLQHMWYRLQHTLGGDLDTTDLGYLDDMVDMICNAGMHCSFEIHGFYYFDDATDSLFELGDANCTPDLFADFWTKIAEHYVARENKPWAYDIVNEPSKGKTGLRTFAEFFDCAQHAITAIRAVDTSVPIIIPGFSYSSTRNWYANGNDGLADLVDPNDNLIFEGHQYFDGGLNGTYLWGETLKYGYNPYDGFIDVESRRMVDDAEGYNTAGVTKVKVATTLRTTLVEGDYIRLRNSSGQYDWRVVSSIDSTTELTVSAALTYNYTEAGNAYVEMLYRDREVPPFVLSPFVNWLRANNKVGLIGESSAPSWAPAPSVNTGTPSAFWLNIMDAACDYFRQNEDVIQYVQFQSGWTCSNTYSWKDNYVMSIFPYGSPFGADNVSGTEQPQTVKWYTDCIGSTWASQLFTNAAPVHIDAITSNGTWTCPAGVTSAHVLIVGGGGSGGVGNGGGGGAGGVVYESNRTVTPLQEYPVVIGAGGAAKTVAGQGNDGGNSTFDTITAYGGGGGGTGSTRPNADGRSGGCGGGAAVNGIGGLGTDGQGHQGSHSGKIGAGGGGAGCDGMHKIKDSNYSYGTGGEGLNYSSVFGTSYGQNGFFGGGGGGASSATAKAYGGVGGGGDGSVGTTAESHTDAESGTANTGGGGGGSYSAATTGDSGAGGSGIVLIGYSDIPPAQSVVGISSVSNLSSLVL